MVHCRGGMTRRQVASCFCLATLLGCSTEPASSTDRDSDTDGGVGEGAAETEELDEDDDDASTAGDPGVTPSCPCIPLEPQFRECAELSTAFEDVNPTATKLFEIDGNFDGRAVVGGGAVYFADRGLEPRLMRFVPGADSAEAQVVIPDAEIEGLAADNDRVWMLVHPADIDGGALMSWNEGQGLVEVASFPSQRAQEPSWSRNHARLRVGHGRALFALRGDEVLGEYPTRHRLRVVDLATGGEEVTETEAAGYAPTPTGWHHLVPEFAERIWCADMACFSDDVVVGWNLAGNNAGPSATSLCSGVREGLAPIVSGWWSAEGEYVYAAGSAVILVHPDGTSEPLWNGDETIGELVLDGKTAFVSTHHDATNHVYALSLDGEAPRRLYSQVSDHADVGIGIAGRINDDLYLTVPELGTDEYLVAVAL